MKGSMPMAKLNIENVKYKHFQPNEKSMRTDGIFQTVLGNPAYKKQLKDLLESILGEEVEEIEVIPEKNAMITKISQKVVRFDLFVICNKNNYLDIEMQNKNMYNDIKRLDYSVSAVFHEIAYNKGEKIKKDTEKEDELKAKAIIFLDYNEFEDGPYHEVLIRTRESNNEKVTDNMDYHIIQFPKFFEQVKEIKTKKEAWIAYLSNQLNKNQMEVLFEMDENIRDIDKLAQDVIDDKELLHEVFYKMRKEAIDQIEKQGMYKHGVENGEKSGKKKKQIEIAKNLITMGMTVEQIMEATGLSKKEIEEIKKIETEEAK